MTRLIVIGAGPMGLAAAYHAAKAGHDVDVLEAGDRPGGMAAHFDFDGLSIERFYHFVCKADQPMFDLMREVGLADAMRWRPTSMGYFVDGKLYDWGDPLSLLRFPQLGLVAKIRYGLQAFTSTKRSDWKKIEHLTAKEWFVAWCGQKTYDRLWGPLLNLKFYEFAERVSASWIATRMKRVGTSRKSLFQEELGYVEGGSEALMNRLAERIAALGGRIHLSTPAEEVVVEDGAVRAVRAGGRTWQADEVICTVPLPYVSRIVQALPQEIRDAYEAVDNIAVVCVLHKLRKPVTRHFWVNIVDPSMDIPGIIEFSNLRPLPETVVYVPYYMPATNPKFGDSDAHFIAKSFAHLQKINPTLTRDDRIASYVGRLRYAQPVCTPNFLDRLPAAQTPVRGLQIADTSYYYPEDRGVSESARLAKEMAQRIGASA